MKGPMTPGRALYERWCGSSESDAALYYDSMNRAGKRRWERLATEVAVREDTERPDGRRWTLESRYDEHGGQHYFKLTGGPEPRGSETIRVVEMRDTKQEEHKASHRIERSTSGMAERCLDCNWSWEYD